MLRYGSELNNLSSTKLKDAIKHAMETDCESFDDITCRLHLKNLKWYFSLFKVEQWFYGSGFFYFIHQPRSSGKCLIDKIICMGEEVRVCYVVTVSFYLTCFSGFSLQISSKGQLEKKKSKNKNFVRFNQSCIWFNVIKLNSVNCSTYHTAILSKLVKQYLNNYIIWRDNVFLCAFFLTL